MQEDVAEGHVSLQGRGGGEISLVLAADFAVIENGRGFSEDEIDVAFDIAVVEIIAAVAVGEDRVLPAEEPAIVERDSVAGDFDGQGLAVRAEGVLEGDVLGGEIIAEDAGRWGWRKCPWVCHRGRAWWRRERR